MESPTLTAMEATEEALPDIADQVIAALSAGMRQEKVMEQFGLTVPQFQSIILERNKATQSLLREWMADESEEQERSWAIAKQAIEENRLSDRSRFGD